MPTITFELNDLNKLVGKKLTLKELEDLVDYAKGEVKGGEKGELEVNFDDTNLPYLWSVEGFARLLKGILGKEKGLAKLNVKKSPEKIIVDKSVSAVRPYVAAFTARGKEVDDYLIKQLIQLQEKLCQSYGRKRENVAIGVYSHKKIKFPVHYKAVAPESIKFVPLEFKREMSLGEILETHPKGIEFSWILKGQKKYPILIDSNKEVLSFPPIINSNYSGKVEAGDKDLFFEATGNDLRAVLLAANIFAYTFAERGFQISEVETDYGSKKVKCPFSFNEKMKLKLSDVNERLGIKLTDAQVKKLLEKARFGYKNGVAFIPDYRHDIIHPVDLIEEIAIMYGYNNIPEHPLESYTVGETFPITGFINNTRDIISGLGYQEIFSPILSNKELLYEKMNIKDFGTVEIEHYMTEHYSVVRTWVLPMLLDVLSKNKHVEYPQRLFEAGWITKKKDLKDYKRLAVVTAHNNATFTEVKQVLDVLMRSFGVDYTIEEINHDSFIEGRVGRVSVKGKEVAFIGEVSPEVLENFGLEVPVAGFELNLSDLFDVL
ncbi:MAG: phenylalanine--tRNA ligase subunit beta [Candidatus Woesearchaeota archaeon]